MSQDLTGDGSLIHAGSDTGIERDLSLLLRIVESAHGRTELGIEQAIRVASEAHFDDGNVDPRTRLRILDWLLRKVAPGAPPSDLHGYFQRVLKNETGIQLEFNQAPNEIESQEHARSEAGSSHASNNVSPIRDENDELGLVDVENGTMSSNLSASIDDQARGELFVNNLPSYFQNAWLRAEAHDLGTLKLQSFDLLSSELLSRPRRENLAAMEYRADYVYERQLAHKVISQWQNVMIEHSDRVNKADKHYERILRKKSHTKVFDVARIQRIQAMDETRLKGSSLYKMALAVRENQWRSSANRKLKMNYLWRLVDYHRTVRAHQCQLETISRQQMSQSEKRTLNRVVNKWVQKIDQVHQNEAIADQHYEQPLRTNFMISWQDKNQEIAARKLTADDLHEYFLKSRLIRELTEAAHEKRNRKEVLSRWTLSRWRQFTETSKHRKYDRAYKVARRNHKHRIARRAFHALQEEHTRLKALGQLADSHLQKKTTLLVNTAIVRWYTKAMTSQTQQSLAVTHASTLSLRHTFTQLATKASQVKMMTTLANQYSLLQTKQIASTLLRRLSLKTFDLQRKTQTALAFNSRYTTRQNRQVMRKHLDLLRVAAADKRGEGPLRLPPATPAQQRHEDMIRLTSTTPLYTPAMAVGIGMGMGTGMGPARRRESAARRREFAARLREGVRTEVEGRVTSRIVEEVEREEGEDGDGEGGEHV